MSSKGSRANQQEKRDRVYLRIKPELKELMQEYCNRHGTNMSQLVTRHFVDLLREEKKDQTVDADSF